MDPEISDQWFYTLKGERFGPAPLAELKAKVDGKEIHPSNDLVWQKGMPSWRPAGEVQELYGSKATPSPPPTPAVKPTPKAQGIQPVPVRQSPASSQNIKWPGARRRSYLFMLIVFPILWSMGFQRAMEAYGPMLGGALNIVTIVGSLIPALMIFLFSLERLTNVGMSRWWVLGYLVPLLNLWVGYRLFAAPAGYTSHGKLGGIGWMLAIFYWVLILATIATIVLVAGVTFMVLTDQSFIDETMKALETNPDLQEVFKNWVDQMQQTNPDMMQDGFTDPAPAPGE